ncbi:ATP-binding cassette domain-containing protein, partial [Enterococcus faecalis]
GKTTLLRCLAGLETIDSGELLLDGVPFNPAEMDNADQVVGVVFQDFQLFPHLSVLENITLAPTLVLKEEKAKSQQEALELLEKLGLAGKEKLYPYQLSGGQKQRVALA